MIPMAKQGIEKTEPNFTRLFVLWTNHKNRKTNPEIFKMWVEMIKPDVPKITEKQFLNFLRRFKDNEKDKEIQAAGEATFNRIMVDREISLVQIENGLRRVTGGLIQDAENIMEQNEESTAPLKERYFALGVVDKVWGKLQKEKEIAIKAHAEKRESVGMFAKLLRGAMSGEFTMKDVQNLKVTAYGDTDKGLAGVASAPEGNAGGAVEDPPVGS